MGEIVRSWFAQAGDFLLGRRTYEIFAGHWPHVPDENPIATALNKLPKYVVSTTLHSVEWHNSTLIGSDVVAEIAELKTQPGRELQVHGSGRLVQTLLAHNLIDEYRLMIYPVSWVPAGACSRIQVWLAPCDSPTPRPRAPAWWPLPMSPQDSPLTVLRPRA